MNEPTTEEVAMMTAKLLRRVANAVDRQLPEGWSYTVLVCPTETDAPELLAVTNAQRIEILDLVQQWVTEMYEHSHHPTAPERIRGRFQ